MGGWRPFVSTGPWAVAQKALRNHPCAYPILMGKAYFGRSLGTAPKYERSVKLPLRYVVSGQLLWEVHFRFACPFCK